MADKPAVVHIGENSPEKIAYKLLHDIARAEGKLDGDGELRADQDWILKKFSAAMMAVQQPSYYL